MAYSKAKFNMSSGGSRNQFIFAYFHSIMKQNNFFGGHSPYSRMTFTLQKTYIRIMAGA
jgi:hypothetical protein